MRQANIDAAIVTENIAVLQQRLHDAPAYHARADDGYSKGHNAFLSDAKNFPTT